jgi:predicted DNA-binding transcriptional regulator AlpA
MRTPSKAANILATAEPTVSLVEAGMVIKIGRSKAYEMARRGEFPVPVLRLGRRLRVPTAALRELVGLPA